MFLTPKTCKDAYRKTVLQAVRVWHEYEAPLKGTRLQDTVNQQRLNAVLEAREILLCRKRKATTLLASEDPLTTEVFQGFPSKAVLKALKKGILKAFFSAVLISKAVLKA